MEWKIGEIKQIKGEWYQCVIAQGGCAGCSFGEVTCICEFECLSYNRSDHKSVIFKKLEKVGDIHENCGKWYQTYKLYKTINVSELLKNVIVMGQNQISVEIKRNMDKEKYTLKPFNIEEALDKPICTRDGHKVRLICTNRKDSTGCNLPIVALIDYNNGTEVLQLYHEDGTCDVGPGLDLMIAMEKKVAYVNLYEFGGIETGNITYESEEEAKKNIDSSLEFIATGKIEWEE